MGRFFQSAKTYITEYLEGSNLRVEEIKQKLKTTGIKQAFKDVIIKPSKAEKNAQH